MVRSGILLVLLLSLLGMDAPADPRITATVSWAPPYLRAEVPAGEQRLVAIDLIRDQPTTLLAAEVDCRCVSLVEAVPLAIPAGRSRLTLRVAGLLPGIKTVTLRTTDGAAEIAVQVAVPGADDGRSALDAIAAVAGRERLRAVAIVHDLRGRLANCGCSSGSLGGIDHLAALPDALRSAGLDGARCLLTGEIDGAHPGLGGALAERGWEPAPPEVPVTAEPLAAVGRTGVLAVIDAGTGISPVAHERIIRPLLDGGAAAVVLLVDPASGRIHSRHLLPIDRSLPVDATIAGRFAEARTLHIAPGGAAQAGTCAACHRQAHTAWSTSAHARAFASLVPASRIDACVTCHSSPATAGRVEDVTCAACHAGSEAHARSPATVRTAGTTGCRACHDALHHPAFDPQAAWARIAHGR